MQLLMPPSDVAMDFGEKEKNTDDYTIGPPDVGKGQGVARKHGNVVGVARKHGHNVVGVARKHELVVCL